MRFDGLRAGPFSPPPSAACGLDPVEVSTPWSATGDGLPPRFLAAVVVERRRQMRRGKRARHQCLAAAGCLEGDQRQRLGQFGQARIVAARGEYRALWADMDVQPILRYVDRDACLLVSSSPVLAHAGSPRGPGAAVRVDEMDGRGAVLRNGLFLTGMGLMPPCAA